MFTELAKQYDQPFLPFLPAAPIDDRAAWGNLDAELKSRLVEHAQACCPAVWPVMLATDYLDFSRTGNRTRYEDKQFERRTRLNTLVLGECVQNGGNFLDDILNGIFLICEESAWQLPAHNSYIRDTPQLPLPDVTRPVIDLFAAETGAVLAMSCFLLGPALDAFSPVVKTMVNDTLSRRIFTPYLTEHFWWMGDGKSHMNNWTAWCTQNVLLAAALSDLKQEQKKAIFLKACQSIDYFLAEYGDDGCCDEGAQYYRHAGLCLFGCMEILNGMTEGHFFKLYQEPKIRNIAAYIQNVHVSGPYYINFADCSPVAGRCNAREFLFGKRTGNPQLMKLAADDYCEDDDPLLAGEHNLYYRLLAVFCHDEILSYRHRMTSAEDLPTNKDNSTSEGHPTTDAAALSGLYYPSVGLFLARDDHFCLAVKTGDNDDSHNHNDTGSFTLYQDGKPLFIDIGVETYQKKTFSPQRYEIWTMQSQYHNLPTFTGCGMEEAKALPYGYVTDFAGTGSIGAMEHHGPLYAARDVEYHFDPDTAWIKMELADAYPDRRVHSYKRQVQIEHGQGITITDRAVCGPLTPVLSLITYEEPVWDPDTKRLIIGQLGRVCVKGAAEVSLERLPITDQRLQTAWKHDLWRILISFQDQLQLHILP